MFLLVSPGVGVVGSSHEMESKMMNSMHILALFAGTPGMPEILLILFVVLLLFGSKKLPGLARSLGRSINEFKRGKDEVMRELTAAEEEILRDEPEPAPKPKGAARKAKPPEDHEIREDD